MLDAAIIALALETRSPSIPHVRAIYFAGAIARIADDEHEGAVLLTNGLRESRWEYVVETCAIEGLGGWGTWGVAGFWARRYPGGTCGEVDAQARASRAVWGGRSGERGPRAGSLRPLHRRPKIPNTSGGLQTHGAILQLRCNAKLPVQRAVKYFRDLH